MLRRYGFTHAARCRRAYHVHVWRPHWVGRWARAWQGGVVALAWPLLLWAAGSVLFGLADHTLRLPLIAAVFGWLATGCCAAAAVLPFVGASMVVASLFRTALQAADREPVPRVCSGDAKRG